MAKPRPICRSLNCSRATSTSASRTTNGSGGRKSRAKCSHSIAVWKTPCPISLLCWGLKTRNQVFSRWTRRYGGDAPLKRSRRLFLRESLNQPLMLIFEDLHWIDSETQGFLDVLSESVASAKVLLLVNYRPEYRSEWGQKTYYTQLRLAPFGKAEAEEFLDVLVGRHRRGAACCAPTTLETAHPGEDRRHARFSWKRWSKSYASKACLGERVRPAGSRPTPRFHLPPPSKASSPPASTASRQKRSILQQLAVIGREFP